MTASDGQSPTEESSQLVLLVSKNFPYDGSLVFKVVDDDYHVPKFAFPSSDFQQFKAISGQQTEILKVKVFICSNTFL